MPLPSPSKIDFCRALGTACGTNRQFGCGLELLLTSLSLVEGQSTRPSQSKHSVAPALARSRCRTGSGLRSMCDKTTRPGGSPSLASSSSCSGPHVPESVCVMTGSPVSVAAAPRN